MIKTIIAGPCSVESRDQLRQVTAALAAMPRVTLLRAGVWKPRTRPGGFEGLGEPALQWMKELQESDLRMADGSHVRFCCEVASPEHVALCLHYGINAFWLGARTTANPFMVEEIGEALRGTDTLVMVKNPLSPDLRLWLGAFERIAQVGIKNLAAIHRGFSMYNNQGYRNAPLWELPLHLRRVMPDLPLICDPSHIGGTRKLIEPLSTAAVQLEYDGLMVEVHPHPADALTDAPQQITPDELIHLATKIIDTLRQRHDLIPAPLSTALAALRSEIDSVDHAMLRMLAHRMDLSRQIATLKSQSQMSVYQAKRWEEVLQNRLSLADELGLSPSFTKELLDKIHAESVRIQMEE